MSDKDFKFIEPLEERPIAKKPKRISRVEQVIMEFAKSDYKYAAVKDELVLEYKNTKGCARAIGRVASTLKKKGIIDQDVKVYSAMDRVYLER